MIVSSVVGSGVTGALVMAFGSGLQAPHGGIWVLPLISNFAGFILAVLIGTLVSAALVVALKSTRKLPEQAGSEQPVAVAA